MKQNFKDAGTGRHERTLESPLTAVSSSETISETLIAPERSRRIAGSNRPQRDPTRVISLTTIGAVSMATFPWIVDFMKTVPRGRAMRTASLQTTAGSRRIDDVTKFGNRKSLAHEFRNDALLFGDPKFVAVTPKLKHGVSSGMQYL